MKASLLKKTNVKKVIKSNGFTDTSYTKNNSLVKETKKVEKSNEKDVVELFTKLKSKEYSKAKIPILKKLDSDIPASIIVKKNLRNSLQDASFRSKDLTRQNSIKSKISIKSNENISVHSNGNNGNNDSKIKNDTKVNEIIKQKNKINETKNEALKRNTFQIIESNISDGKLQSNVKFGFNRTFVPHEKNKEKYDPIWEEKIKNEEEKKKLKEIFETKVKIKKDEYIKLFNDNYSLNKNEKSIRNEKSLKHNSNSNNFSNNNSLSNFYNYSNNSSMNEDIVNENGSNVKYLNKHKKIFSLKKKIDNRDFSKQNELKSNDVIDNFNSFFTKDENYDQNNSLNDLSNNKLANTNYNSFNNSNIPKYAFNITSYDNSKVDPVLIKALDEVNEDYSKLKKMLNKVKSERKIQVQKIINKVNEDTSNNVKTHLSLVKSCLENQKQILSNIKTEEFKKLRFNNSVDYILAKENCYRSNLKKHDNVYNKNFNGFKNVLNSKALSQTKKRFELQQLYTTNSEMIQNEKILSKTYVECLSQKIKEEKRTMKVKKINELVEKKKKLASSCLDEIEQVLDHKDKLIKKQVTKSPYIMSLESERKFRDRIKFKFK